MAQQLSAQLTYEFQYDTKTQRTAHIILMQDAGFTVSGPVMRSTDPYFGKTPRQFKPYALFTKPAGNCEIVVPDVPTDTVMT